MKNKKVKTIDIQAKSWLDKVNGNSYFAGLITVNFGMKDERRYNMPFQYGYGDYYLQSAEEMLIKNKEIKDIKGLPLIRYCRENNIILRHYKQLNCRKSELKEYNNLDNGGK